MALIKLHSQRHHVMLVSVLPCMLFSVAARLCDTLTVETVTNMVRLAIGSTGGNAGCNDGQPNSLDAGTVGRCEHPVYPQKP